MLQGTYTAALGIASHQQRLDTIANNLANVSTNGFKSTRVDFKDAIYKEMQRPHGNAQNVNVDKGHGVLVDTMKRSFTQGIYQDSDSDTDMLIEGEGFFMVETQSGQRYLTRDGSFRRSMEADGNYLITATGSYVLDENGNKIRLQGNSLVVQSDGSLRETGTTEPYGRIGVWTVPNEEGLVTVSGNLFSVSAASGGLTPVTLGGGGSSIMQYAMEGSNVNLGDEFASLVRASRAMQLSSRALTTADEMDGTAIQSRR